MDQTNVILDELARNGRAAYRRLVRARAPKLDHGSRDREEPADQIAGLKKQLRVDLKLQRSAPWAFRPLRTAALESHLAHLLRSQSLRTQQTSTRPPPAA